MSCLVPLGIESGHAQTSFELKNGDRVAFLGDTFVERAIRFGHIETALAARWPDRNIVFRNIGWSGDSVGGRARAFFDPIDAGFENLKSHVQLADPSVVFVCYGAMASFEGEAGLDAFIRNYNTLLDTVATGDRRLVMLSPTPREALGHPMPDPTIQNQNLKVYTEALRLLASKRGIPFVDLFSTLVTSSAGRQTKAITDNGIHLNNYGYTLAAERIVQALAEYSSVKRLSLDKDGAVKEAMGISASVSIDSDGGLGLELQDERLSLSRG
ncbi:MAG: SGNH/GDSL hydrolase family protein [Opitutales bacterium]|nr:SGNH/GDSL hydrolase family protein [Opitutales bacterium]